MTAKELILETVEYYKNNKRAVDENGICKYIDDEGNMCAVGRCLIDPTDIKFDNPDDTSVCYIIDLEDNIKSMYKTISIDTWKELQYLHDTDSFWYEHELTKRGEAYVNELLESYA